MFLLGWRLGVNFRELIADFDHWLAFILLSSIGGKMIYESLQSEADKPKFNPLDFTTLLGLAIATSIDALAAGLGLSLLNIPIIYEATLIGVITFLLSFAGVFIGHKIGNKLNNKIEIMGGLILIAIGSKILIEHLFLL